MWGQFEQRTGENEDNDVVGSFDLPLRQRQYKWRSLHSMELLLEVLRMK